MDYIFLNNRKYYYYGTYDSYSQAYMMARRFKRRNRAKYYIMIVGDAIFTARHYRLYLDRVVKLWQ